MDVCGVHGDRSEHACRECNTKNEIRLAAGDLLTLRTQYEGHDVFGLALVYMVDSKGVATKYEDRAGERHDLEGERRRRPIHVWGVKAADVQVGILWADYKLRTRAAFFSLDEVIDYVGSFLKVRGIRP